MHSKKTRRLEAAKALVARLESELVRELAGLHAHYGFRDVRTFLISVEKAAHTGGRKANARVNSLPRGRKRRRTQITDDMRREVRKLVMEGKTGGEIAATVGISLPSVQNIKREAGLVQARNGKRLNSKKAAGERKSKRASRESRAKVDMLRRSGRRNGSPEAPSD